MALCNTAVIILPTTYFFIVVVFRRMRLFDDTVRVAQLRAVFQAGCVGCI